MTTLLNENNHRIESDFGKLSLATNDYIGIRRQAELARAKAIADLFGKMFSGAPKATGKTEIANTEPLATTAPAEPNSFSQEQRVSMAKAIAIGEVIANAISTAERFVRNVIVTPLGRVLTRQHLISELSGLSDRTLADIGIRRMDILTVTQNAYPIYVAENGVPDTAVDVPAVDPRTTGAAEQPANDDDAHRNVA